jgi:prolyl-tRNA synthetase
MQNVYADFAENFMAMPVIKGEKTENERFAGALNTYAIEALMQDGRALQAGTSHFLGQNFAKAFDVKYTTKEGKQEFVWATSWGVSTRLIGALVMTHSDDNGLVLPPKLAPIQLVVIPIYKSEEQLQTINEKVEMMERNCKELGISVKYDNRTTYKPGWKFAEYELKGVPIRIAIGPRDIENNTVELVRRDTLKKETVSQENIASRVLNMLEEIQNDMFNKALNFRNNLITKVDTFDEFKDVLKNKGGFVSAHWDGSAETEEEIKNITKATIRCVINDIKEEEGKCVYSGQKSFRRVLFAKAY